MRTNKFFRIIILLLGFITVSCSYNNVLTSEQGVESTATAIADQPLELKPFKRIRGTKYLMAEVATTESYENSFSNVRKSGGEVRNLVFLDSETLLSHLLFETNTTVIVKTSEYPNSIVETDSYYPTPQDDDATASQWLVYQMVKEDTNGDGDQDSDDLRTIAVSDANGNNYTELLHNISKLNGMTMMEAGQLIVIYNQDETNKVSILDVENRTVITTKEIVDIGTEIE